MTAEVGNPTGAPLALSPKRLRCPYYAVNPLAHQGNRACNGLGFPDIPRLIEHLKKFHVLAAQLAKLNSLPRVSKAYTEEAKLKAIYQETHGVNVNLPSFYVAPSDYYRIFLRDPPQWLSDEAASDLRNNRPQNVWELLSQVERYLDLMDRKGRPTGQAMHSLSTTMTMAVLPVTPPPDTIPFSLDTTGMGFTAGFGIDPHLLLNEELSPANLAVKPPGRGPGAMVGFQS